MNITQAGPGNIDPRFEMCFSDYEQLDFGNDRAAGFTNYMGNSE